MRSSLTVCTPTTPAIKTGDTLNVGDTAFTVVGLAAFVDYTTLFENNTDTMFDAMTFDIAITTDAGFERISISLYYNYAYRYANAPADTNAEKALSDNFLKALITQTAASENETEIKDYVPAYANQAMTFAPDDMGSDKAMGGVLLYILTAVLAFIFAVTIYFRIVSYAVAVLDGHDYKEYLTDVIQ